MTAIFYLLNCNNEKVDAVCKSILFNLIEFIKLMPPIGLITINEQIFNKIILLKTTNIDYNQ